MEKNTQVKLILDALPEVMGNANHWSGECISAEALNSQQPFCLDTMNFSQWLQFVFIPRMLSLMDAEQALPSLAKGQGIEPMASEFYKNTEADRAILVLIRQLDDLLQG